MITHVSQRTAVSFAVSKAAAAPPTEYTTVLVAPVTNEMTRFVFHVPPLNILVSVVSSMSAYLDVMAPAAVIAAATLSDPSKLPLLSGPMFIPPRRERIL